MPHSVIESEISPLIPDLAKGLFDQQDQSPEKPARMSPAIRSFLEYLQQSDPKIRDGLAPMILPYLIKIAKDDRSEIKDKVDALSKSRF